MASGRALSTSSPASERLRPLVMPLRASKDPKAWDADSKVSRGRLRNQRAWHKFCDWKRVRVSGGDGGDGGIFTTSLHGVEYAGPDGGDGGNGGHVLFRVKERYLCFNYRSC